MKAHWMVEPKVEMKVAKMVSVKVEKKAGK
jgi:hypothetical protein